MVAPVLTPERLQQISNTLARFRPSTCAIQTAGAKDAEGVPGRTGGTTVATVGCRVGPAGRRAVEATFGPTEQTNADAIIALPRGTAVTARNVIVATIEGVETTFEVIDVAVGSHVVEPQALCMRTG